MKAIIIGARRDLRLMPSTEAYREFIGLGKFSQRTASLMVKRRQRE
jgi:hypothetical protein